MVSMLVLVLAVKFAMNHKYKQKQTKHAFNTAPHHNIASSTVTVCNYVC